MASTDDFDSNPDIFGLIAEREIVQAMEDGKFDNLVGAGKPLDLDKNQYVSAGESVLNRIMKDSGAVPVWVELEREVEEIRSQAEAILARWRRESTGLRNTQQYEDHRKGVRIAYAAALKLCNDFVLKSNMSGPSMYRQVMPVPRRALLEAFDLEFGTESARD